jgi:hypothetical protein
MDKEESTHRGNSCANSESEDDATKKEVEHKRRNDTLIAVDINIAPFGMPPKLMIGSLYLESTSTSATVDQNYDSRLQMDEQTKLADRNSFLRTDPSSFPITLPANSANDRG